MGDGEFGVGCAAVLSCNVTRGRQVGNLYLSFYL
jgi:hypothetical protein